MWWGIHFEHLHPYGEGGCVILGEKDENMVRNIVLNDTEIEVKHYDRKTEEGHQVVSFIFDVTSEEYHDVTVLLYKGTFDIRIPEEGLDFKGTIINYSTSLDNLYEEGQTGEFRVTLQEV